MQITTFNPMIITKHPDNTVQLFEALGFEKRHQPNGTSKAGYEYTDFRMTDKNGFHVDIAYSSGVGDRDLMAIRVNVDDFEEAYKLLTEHGFVSSTGKPATETECSQGILMAGPSGFGIVLCKHIKE